ncbi:sensor histidine kinase [Brasilonema octagenarum UFV-E1]|uniref:Sensor histidine kinase n=1 Tax=Brasilonema sennae CENA114 TaxID=415709 RepID=A0A856MM09_9CYAN|nr:sensor histidine kinase [Brasilonema sennae]QDL11124.1 sensor histidine kinase [Brasilonema sennae CENA114]QDL17470.1 sensor histidine kinase [Brasilonema octagenarum UFV-E1]
MSPSFPSLRLLLYLEWLLLGMSLLAEFLIPPIYPFHTSPWFTVLRIVVFGVMGLRLPKQNFSYKVIYTVVEFGILLLPALTNNHLRCAPLLGLIAVIRSCQMFNLKGRLIVAALVYISYLYTEFLRISRTPVFFKMPLPLRHGRACIGPPMPPPNTVNFILNNAITFALTLTFVLLLVNAVLAERRSRQELAFAHEQLRQYALRIENQATLQERNRIAREIHDSLGHALTAQTIQLENALLLLPSNVDKAIEFLQQVKQLGYQALQEVSRSVATLRADPLRGKSLEKAIDNLIRDFSSATTLTPECKISLTSPVTSEVGTAIYRILQEALTNISKHSGATEVSVQLQTQTGRINLLVEDNGKGFYPEQNTTGFGLQGMRERATALGGNFNIMSKQGAGCRIQVSILILESSMMNSEPATKNPKSKIL